MAKKSVIARQFKRTKKVAKYAALRAQLKQKVSDIALSAELRWQAQQQLQQLPRDASPVRLVNRCHLTGRPRGVLRRFNMSRNMLRIYAMQGDVPGIVKASW